MSETRVIRTAVVGVGGFGRHHARILGEIDEAQLVAVVDVNTARHDELAERYGVPVLSSVDDLPQEVEAVSVAVPTEHHAAVALPLLRRGVSTLIEKPMVQSVEEGRQLIAAAQEGGAVLQVGHVERWNPVVRSLRERDIQPRYLDAQRVAPFSFRSADVGVVLDLMIHDLDIVLHLVGSRPIRVEAVGVPVLTQHEDICNARVVFENGCVASLTASRVATKVERRIRVFSSDSYLTVDFGSREAMLMSKTPELTPERVRGLAGSGASPDVIKSMIFGGLVKVEKLPVEEADALTEEIRDFLRCVRDGARPEVGGAEGLAAVELGLAVVEALGSHEPVRIQG